MNRKNMPLLLMLIAGACTWIVTLVRSYSLLASLVALFTVMLLFYCLGSVNRFDRQNEEKAKQEQEEKEKALQEEEAAGSQEDTAQKGVSDSNG